MRVSREKSAENRASLLKEAGRLFRERGIDGVGVAEIAKAAGLTHGALYAHFPSKEALAAAAFAEGFERSLSAMLRSADQDRPSYSSYIDFLLSPVMRDALANGCPMTASASEIGRQGEEVSRRFVEGFGEMAGAIARTLGDALPDDERRRLALATIAAEVGAIAIARAVAKTDAVLSEEVIDATRALLKGAAEA